MDLVKEQIKVKSLKEQQQQQQQQHVETRNITFVTNESNSLEQQESDDTQLKLRNLTKQMEE
eukprot:14843012-Ditylum_brightwellii.AAC.1